MLKFFAPLLSTFKHFTQFILLHKLLHKLF